MQQNFKKHDRVRSSFYFKVNQAPVVTNSSWFAQDFPGFKPESLKSQEAPGKLAVPHGCIKYSENLTERCH